MHQRRLDAKLVIELDGVQPHEPDAVVYDFERTKVLESLGLKPTFRTYQKQFLI